MAIVAIDTGSYSYKTSSGVLIPAKITEEEILFNDNHVLELDGKIFTLGIGEYNTNYSKIEKDNFIPLLLGAIALSTEDTDVKIVVGAPVAHYKSTKDTIKEIINGYNQSSFKINGIYRNLYINEIEVFPEGIASFYALNEEYRNSMTKDLIIIDIGGRTTDIAIFKKVGNKRIIVNPQSLPVGMLNIYSDVVRAINSKYPRLKKELEDAENILRNGLEIYGEKQDLSFIKPIINKHIDKIFKELNINYPIETEDSLLTGGGAYLLKGLFKKRIPNIIVPENSLFTNAYGLKKVGESLWKD
jgi:plasmid segregation protein ParM